MEDHRVAIRRATAVLLVTSAVLILPGLAGIGASLRVVIGLGAAVLALAAVREPLATAPTVLGYDLGRYAPDLWLAVGLALCAVVVFPDATAVELQSLGGLAGFVAMVNYFLTPVYSAIYAILTRLAGRLSNG